MYRCDTEKCSVDINGDNEQKAVLVRRNAGFNDDPIIDDVDQTRGSRREEVGVAPAPPPPL